MNIKPNQAIRKNEAEFKDNDIISIVNDDTKLIDAIIKFPKILERPIIVIGNNAVIDSKGLIGVCLSLEDLSNELDFEFDWTSEKAMSNKFSIGINRVN